MTTCCHPLDALRLIPVCPKTCGVHNCQAPLLARLRPGQWVQQGCVKTCFERERWVLGNAKASSDVIDALSKCENIKQQATRSTAVALQAAEFVVHRKTASFISIFFFTHFRQWLDVIEVSVEPAADGGAPIVASAHSFSAAIAPASSPIAVLSSILLACIPFGDMGQNALHLRTLRKLLADEGIQVDVDRAR